jgi:predicted nucleic acid-binding protein
LEIALRGQHSILISVPLVLEYEAVLTRPQQLAASGLNAQQVGKFLDGICSIATPVEISSLWRPFLRDPDDEMVLETAALGRADLLLTFNVRDFVGCERFHVKACLPGPAWIETYGVK